MIGDIVKIDAKQLNLMQARTLAFSGHLFVVIGETEDMVNIATITSQIETAKRFSHYVFENWKEEPFVKPCAVNLSSNGWIRKEFIAQTVGSLTQNDIEGMMAIVNSGIVFRTQKIESIAEAMHLLRFVE